MFSNSHLYGNGLGFIKAIHKNVISSTETVTAIIAVVYKMEALSTVNDFFKYFSGLLTLRHEENEYSKKHKVFFLPSIKVECT